MFKFVKIIFALCSALLCVSIAQATSNQPTTFLGPTLQGSFSSWMSPIAAFSIIGEAAPKNYRLNLTAGFKIDEVSRIKLTAEFLEQDIKYGFVLGDTTRWMKQYAAGLDYEYFVGCSRDHSIEIAGYGSYAPSRNLGEASGFVTYDTLTGPTTVIYTTNQRIAGSAAYGLLGGVNFYLWPGSKVGVDLRYDNVNYRRVYDPDYPARGFGGTVKLQQLFGDHVRINLLGELRRPFANYEASLNWDNFYYHGRWGAGIFGRYTYGRTLLPNTWNAGLNLDYFIDCTPVVIRDYKNLKSEATTGPIDTDFLNWVHDPAVYMPQVLAIADEAGVVRCGLGAPVAVGTIPDQGEVLPLASVIINVAPYFRGSNLTYTITANPNFSSFGDVYTVDPTSGLVYLYNSGNGPEPDIFPMVFTVTASNGCGSVTQTITAEFNKEVAFKKIEVKKSH